MKSISAVALLLCATWALGYDPKAKWEGEAAFAEKTRMHHGMGLKMAERCQKKATRNELKQFCAKSAEGQQKDLEKLNRIVPSDTTSHSGKAQAGGASHGEAHTGPTETRPRVDKAQDDKRRMHAQGMQMMDKLDRMSGDQFERMFIAHNIKHHQMMIDMASGCEQNAESAELKGLCSDLKAKQTSEKQQLTQWEAQWFGKAKSETAAR